MVQVEFNEIFGMAETCKSGLKCYQEIYGVTIRTSRRCITGNERFLFIAILYLK